MLMMTRKNIPNILTTIRLIALVPFGVILAVSGTPSIWAAVIFALSCLTDWFDGFLARRWDATSKYGQMIDPLADRLLIGLAVALVAYHDERMPWWAAAVVLGRDLFVVLGYLLVKKISMPQVNYAGKIATAILMLSLLCMMATSPSQTWPVTIFWIGFGFSLLALGMYIEKYIKLVLLAPWTIWRWVVPPVPEIWPTMGYLQIGVLLSGLYHLSIGLYVMIDPVNASSNILKSEITPDQELAVRMLGSALAGLGWACLIVCRRASGQVGLALQAFIYKACATGFGIYWYYQDKWELNHAAPFIAVGFVWSVFYIFWLRDARRERRATVQEVPKESSKTTV